MATSTPRSIRFPTALLGQGEDMAHVLGMSFNKLIVGLLQAAVNGAPDNQAFVQLVEQLVEDDQRILARLGSRRRPREEILAAARSLPDDWGFDDLTEDERDSLEGGK